MPSNETILEEAQRLVYGDRNKDYGSPLSDYTKVAKLWSIVLGTEITPLQAALCMCCIKISREVNKHKRDNLVDLAGYAAVANWIIEDQEVLKNGQQQSVGKGTSTS